MHRWGRVASGVAACLLLAACGTAASADNSPQTWVPQPSFGNDGNAPGLSPAEPGAPSRPPSANPAPNSPGPSTSAPAQDPNVVAKHLTSPDAIAVLPDNTALVGERTTGRIVRVQPQAGQPVQTVRTLPVDPTNGGGLLDLALSPTYGQDNLIFALITTTSDTRVIDFTLTGATTPVLIGIPRGASDNRGRILFGADGRLYVGTGDAGNAAAAADPASLSGKVLRVTDVGGPAPLNPTPGSAVFTRGHHVVAGLCLVPGTNRVLEVEPDATGRVEVNQLAAGADFGWANRTTGTQGPSSTLPTGQTETGGCAMFDRTLYVTSRDRQNVLSAPVTVKGAAVSVGTYTPMLAKRYGRLDTIVAAPDGALWITTSNKDGAGHPIADDERVLRIVPGGGSAKSPL